jgi:hypothetical protein
VAFQAFTKAKGLECLLECGKASKKEVAEAYFVAYEEDKKCNSLFHNAFAVEAFLEYFLLQTFFKPVNICKNTTFLNL